MSQTPGREEGIAMFGSFTLRRHRGRAGNRRRAHRAARAIIIVGAVLIEAVALRRRGYGMLGGNVVVRCQRGHLFTTIWVPAASLKSLRLSWWRLQRCPVGHHWSIVTPVRESDLRPWQRRRARAHHDIRVP
jgi:hypothetical protein